MAQSKKAFDLLQFVRPSVRKLKPYASAKDDFDDYGREMIYIDANESPFENGFNRYPDPNQRSLKKRIGEIKGIGEDQILLGNGSDEVLDLIFRVFLEAGKDNVIISVPTFGMFGVLAAQHEIELRSVLMKPGFQLDLDGIKAEIDQDTKIIFVCSPNNPSGNAVGKDDLLALLALPVLVVLDEAYVDFAREKSMLPELAAQPNLIICQTFSKAWGMAGLRLGMCFARAEIITYLKKVKMPYNVNILTQQVALERLEDLERFEAEVDTLLAEREALEVGLAQINWVEEIYPSDANFLLVKVDDALSRYKALIEQGVVVRNRHGQPLCDQCLRISVGTADENARLLNLMKQMENGESVKTPKK